MKDNKKTEVATNMSSGAEKVETVEKQLKNQDGVSSARKTVKTENGKGARAQKTSVTEEKKIDVKKRAAESADGKAERESEAANARVAAALKKKEEKARRKAEKEKTKKARAAAKKAKAESRLAEKKAQAEKRAAEKKAKAEKHAQERKKLAEKRAAEKKARAEKRAAEKEARIRERAHGKANRSQARERARNERRARRNAKRNAGKNGDGQEKRSGYGGWLAAVISLGTVTLALSTVVTIGAIDMKNTKNGVMSGYRSTAYEMIGIMEHVDDDLDRVRISASPAQQERILTDLLVQARLVELDLEKMPVSAEADANLTSFINRVAATSERLLNKLRLGGTLSEEDAAALQRLYETNHTARRQLDEFAGKMQDGMIARYIKKGEGELANVLEGLEKLTLEENRLALNGKESQTEGAGKGRNAVPEDGEGGSKIDAAKAEEVCRQYFTQYHVKDFQCIGETVARGYTAYNVQGYDDNGTLLFAEVDMYGGNLVRFNYYEPCEKTNFDVENSKRIAEEFLQQLGYEDMVAVRVNENGTEANFTFAYETDGVVFHPDSVKIKVCRERGLVNAFDAASYLKNHKERSVPETKVTMEQAKNKLHEGLTVESSALTVVQARGGERAAYEFLCSYGEEKYFVYTDADTGEELSIVNVKNLG